MTLEQLRKKNLEAVRRYQANNKDKVRERGRLYRENRPGWWKKYRGRYGDRKIAYEWRYRREKPHIKAKISFKYRRNRAIRKEEQFWILNENLFRSVDMAIKTKVELKEMDRLDVNNLEQYTRTQILDALRLSDGELAELTVYRANLWLYAKKQGYLTTDCEPPLAKWYPAIAAGTLLPLLAYWLMHKPAILDRVSRLKPHDQQAILDAELMVKVIAERGRKDYLMVSILDLDDEQIWRLGIGDGKLRAPEDQAGYTRAQERKARTGKKVAIVEADPVAGVVKASGREIVLGDVVAAYNSIKLLPTDETPEVSYNVGPFTRSVDEKLRKLAGNRPVSQFIRDWLLAQVIQEVA